MIERSQNQVVKRIVFFQGPMGLVAVTTTAVSHVNNIRDTDELDIIPVDICVKGMIIAAWKQWRDQQNLLASEMPIYNATSVKVCSYNSMMMSLTDSTEKYPPIKLFGIPSMTMTKCVFYAWIIRIFRCILPALIVDGFLKLTGNKPQ